MGRLENLVGAHSVAVADRLRAVGAGHDLSASEQGALVTVLAHPDRPVSWLGEVLGLTSSGVTRLVDRLADRGWVTRTAATDARQRRLRLTAAGARRARSLNAARNEVLEGVLEPLSRAERADLERLLDRVVANLHDEFMPTMHTCRLCDREACRAGGRSCPLDHTVPDDA
jgi:DNA-binding MarR family transcriptional regulator